MECPSCHVKLEGMIFRAFWQDEDQAVVAVPALRRPGLGGHGHAGLELLRRREQPGDRLAIEPVFVFGRAFGAGIIPWNGDGRVDRAAALVGAIRSAARG